jgi:hypothetical protein
VDLRYERQRGSLIGEMTHTTVKSLWRADYCEGCGCQSLGYSQVPRLAERLDAVASLCRTMLMAHSRPCLDRLRWSMLNGPWPGWLVAIVVPEVGTLLLDYGRAVAKPDLSRHPVAL